MCKRDGSPIKQTLPFLSAIGTALATAAVVAEPTGQKVAPVTKVVCRTRTNNTAPAFRLTENNAIVLNAAPREGGAEAETIDGPVAEYLSTVEASAKADPRGHLRHRGSTLPLSHSVLPTTMGSQAGTCLKNEWGY